MSKNTTDTNQASEELREIFIDRMWNYFGIEDKSELAYFGTIYDQAVAPIIRTEKLKLLAEVRERAVDTCIKYIRSGQVGGSFSEGCTCEKCDKYEKKVRDDLAQLTQNPKSEEAEL